MEISKLDLIRSIGKKRILVKRREGFFAPKDPVEDYVWLQNRDEFYKFGDIARRKSATDWALLNNVWKNNYYRALNGQFAVYYYLRNESNGTAANYSDIRGELLATGLLNMSNGIAPSIYYAIPKKNEIVDDIITNNRGEFVEDIEGEKRKIKLGLYPKNVATSEAEELERLYNNGDLLEGLRATGRFITSNNKRANEGGFWKKKNPEFIYKGQRYIRTRYNPVDLSEKSGMDRHFSDGTKFPEDGGVVWVKEEPMTFIIKNWYQMPRYINPNGNGYAKCMFLEAVEAMLSNIPLMNVNWKDNLIRAFLNGLKFKQLVNGVEYDFTGEGFFQEAFNPDREKITEYELKPKDRIGNYAFEGCVSLNKISIPFETIILGHDIFAGCKFDYMYVPLLPANIILSRERLPYEDSCNYYNRIDINEVRKYFKGFSCEYEVFIQDMASMYIDTFNSLKEENLFFPFSYVKEMIDDGYIYYFMQHGDFRFFKNDFPNLEKLFEKNTQKQMTGFYKFASAIGVFSKEKMIDKNGQKFDYTVGQKASSLLYRIVKSGAITFEQFENIFASSKIGEDYEKANQNFLKFISLQEGEGNFPKIKILLELEKSFPGIFIMVMSDFENAKKMRKSINQNGENITLSWQDAFAKYYVYKKSRNENTEEKESIDEIFAEHGISYTNLEKAKKLFKIAQENNVPEHILGVHLREETARDRVEKLKDQTGEILLECKNIIEQTYNKQFFYDFLSKKDPINAIIGICGADCCATILSDTYGKKIASSTITSDEVQNIVIREHDGSIAAKGALYINREIGYGVINDFEINEKYKTNKAAEPGIYFDSVASQHEKERNKIFDAFMRAIKAFVYEYDKQNPNCPIRQVNVGMGYNRLKAQCQKYEQARVLLSVPNEYSFTDASEGQYVLYSLEGSEEQQEDGGEDER